MIDIIGYTGVFLGLFAITKKRMLAFRIWHIISCLCFILYAILISAYPIILSGVAFIAIHTFHIAKMNNNTKNE